jgi:hypothetical protein
MGIQPPVLLPGKVSFMQHRRATIVVSRFTTAGVLNGHDGIRADAKSYHGKIHTKVSSAQGAADFMQARQGKAESSSAAELLWWKGLWFLVRLLAVVRFMQR